MDIREKEELKLKLVNKFAKAATFDKDLGEWSVNFDRICDIVEVVVDNFETGGE